MTYETNILMEADAPLPRPPVCDYRNDVAAPIQCIKASNTTITGSATAEHDIQKTTVAQLETEVEKETEVRNESEIEDTSASVNENGYSIVKDGDKTYTVVSDESSSCFVRSQMSAFAPPQRNTEAVEDEDENEDQNNNNEGTVKQSVYAPPLANFMHPYGMPPGMLPQPGFPPMFGAPFPGSSFFAGLSGRPPAHLFAALPPPHVYMFGAAAAGGEERRRRRTRTFFNAAQLEELEASFACVHYPSPEERKRLVKECNLNEDCIEIWFKNRRAKNRKIHMAAKGMMSGENGDSDENTQPAPPPKVQRGRTKAPVAEETPRRSARPPRPSKRFIDAEESQNAVADKSIVPKAKKSMDETPKSRPKRSCVSASRRRQARRAAASIVDDSNDDDYEEDEPSDTDEEIEATSSTVVRRRQTRRRIVPATTVSEAENKTPNRAFRGKSVKSEISIQNSMPIAPITAPVAMPVSTIANQLPIAALTNGANIDIKQITIPPMVPGPNISASDSDLTAIEERRQALDSTLRLLIDELYTVDEDEAPPLSPAAILVGINSSISSAETPPRLERQTSAAPPPEQPNDSYLADRSVMPAWSFDALSPAEQRTMEMAQIRMAMALNCSVITDRDNNKIIVCNYCSEGTDESTDNEEGHNSNSKENIVKNHSNQNKKLKRSTVSAENTA